MARSRTTPVPLKQDAKAKLQAILEEENYDPLREVLKILKKKGSRITDQQRLSGALELLQYRYPKLKAIEVEGKVATDFQITIQKFGHLIAGVEETPKVLDPDNQPKALETKAISSPGDDSPASGEVGQPRVEL